MSGEKSEPVPVQVENPLMDEVRVMNHEEKIKKFVEVKDDNSVEDFGTTQDALGKMPDLWHDTKDDLLHSNDTGDIVNHWDGEEQPQEHPLDKGVFQNDMFIEPSTNTVYTVGEKRNVGDKEVYRFSEQHLDESGDKQIRASVHEMGLDDIKAYLGTKKESLSLLEPGYDRDPVASTAYRAKGNKVGEEARKEGAVLKDGETDSAAKHTSHSAESTTDMLIENQDTPPVEAGDAVEASSEDLQNVADDIEKQLEAIKVAAEAGEITPEKASEMADVIGKAENMLATEQEKPLDAHAELDALQARLEQEIKERFDALAAQIEQKYPKLDTSAEQSPAEDEKPEKELSLDEVLAKLETAEDWDTLSDDEQKRRIREASDEWYARNMEQGDKDEKPGEEKDERSDEHKRLDAFLDQKYPDFDKKSPEEQARIREIMGVLMAAGMIDVDKMPVLEGAKKIETETAESETEADQEAAEKLHSNLNASRDKYAELTAKDRTNVLGRWLMKDGLVSRLIGKTESGRSFIDRINNTKHSREVLEAKTDYEKATRAILEVIKEVAEQAGLTPEKMHELRMTAWVEEKAALQAKIVEQQMKLGEEHKANRFTNWWVRHNGIGGKLMKAGVIVGASLLTGGAAGAVFGVAGALTGVAALAGASGLAGSVVGALTGGGIALHVNERRAQSFADKEKSLTVAQKESNEDIAKAGEFAGKVSERLKTQVIASMLTQSVEERTNEVVAGNRGRFKIAAGLGFAAGGFSGNAVGHWAYNQLAHPQPQPQHAPVQQPDGGQSQASQQPVQPEQAPQQVSNYHIGRGEATEHLLRDVAPNQLGVNLTEPQQYKLINQLYNQLGPNGVFQNGVRLGLHGPGNVWIMTGSGDTAGLTPQAIQIAKGLIASGAV